ncbi:MAG TPA: pentapeptide repeat-containing protein, partial [Acetobacteraceae bacterium]
MRLPEAQLAEVLWRHAAFRDSRPGGRRAVLSATDLSGLNLAGHDLSHADFTSASFYGANLAGCRFDCATLFACDFRQANLENASL